MTPSDLIKLAFPLLSACDWEITSPPKANYNCIAWAAEDSRRWWEPIPPPTRSVYWPAGARRARSVEAHAEAFATLGYSPCEPESLEQGVQKIALFADAKANCTHAARQLEDGNWTSKLGEAEDVRHPLRALVGDRYGNVALLMSRPRPPGARDPRPR